MIKFILYVLKKFHDLAISTILTFVAPFGMVNMMSPFFWPDSYIETNKLVITGSFVEWVKPDKTSATSMLQSFSTDDYLLCNSQKKNMTTEWSSTVKRDD